MNLKTTPTRCRLDIGHRIADTATLCSSYPNHAVEWGTEFLDDISTCAMKSGRPTRSTSTTNTARTPGTHTVCRGTGHEAAQRERAIPAHRDDQAHPALRFAERAEPDRLTPHTGHAGTHF
jgi:hypothetical protein